MFKNKLLLINCKPTKSSVRNRKINLRLITTNVENSKHYFLNRVLLFFNHIYDFLKRSGINLLNKIKLVSFVMNTILVITYLFNL